ncbi:hypothetical protein OQZ33_22830 [Pedobacter sp. MC2016-05]|nr:hypothetical protein [Pedobacter sp. MC2016-05]
MIQAVVILLTLIIICKGLPAMLNTEVKSFKSQLSILRRPRFLAGTGLNLFLIPAWFCSYSYFADYLSKAMGLAAPQISYMLLLFGVMGVISNFLVGRLLRKHMFSAMLFFLASPFLVPFAFQYFSGSFFSIAPVVGFWGVMYGHFFDWRG